jgi:hypothetical protein
MITLKQISDLFIRDWSGGDPSKDSRLHPKEVIKKARVFLNTALKPEYFTKWNDGDKSAITLCIYPYELSLSTDSTGQKYVTLPEAYISLPHNKGVHRVYVKGNPWEDYTIMHNPGVSGTLPHTKIKGNSFCYIEGLKIWMGPGATTSKADRIIAQIICAAPDAVGENDSLPVNPETVTEVLRLLKLDYAPVSQVPVDNLNNQNSNIR